MDSKNILQFFFWHSFQISKVFLIWLFCPTVAEHLDCTMFFVFENASELSGICHKIVNQGNTLSAQSLKKINIRCTEQVVRGKPRSAALLHRNQGLSMRFIAFCHRPHRTAKAINT